MLDIVGVRFRQVCIIFNDRDGPHERGCAVGFVFFHGGKASRLRHGEHFLSVFEFLLWHVTEKHFTVVFN